MHLLFMNDEDKEFHRKLARHHIRIIGEIGIASILFVLAGIFASASISSNILLLHTTVFSDVRGIYVGRINYDCPYHY